MLRWNEVFDFFFQIMRRRSPSSEWRIISSTRRTPILLGDHNIPITTNTNLSHAKLNAAKNLYTIKLHCSFTKSIQQKLVDAVINHCLYSGIELEAVRNLLKNIVNNAIHWHGSYVISWWYYKCHAKKDVISFISKYILQVIKYCFHFELTI